MFFSNCLIDLNAELKGQILFRGQGKLGRGKSASFPPHPARIAQLVAYQLGTQIEGMIWGSNNGKGESLFLI